MAGQVRLTVGLGAVKIHPDGLGYALQLVFNGVPANWIWICSVNVSATNGPVRHARLTSEQVAEWRTVYDPASDTQQPSS